MKNIALIIAIVALAPFAARLANQYGFYILIGAVALVALLLLARSKKGREDVSTIAPEVAGQSWRRRLINALKAVRKRKMTLAQASAHYGVSEKAIKRLHHFDYLITHH